MKESEIKDFEKLLENLEKQGWHPMVCDTPVPFYDNDVMCGVPNSVGDVVKVGDCLGVVFEMLKSDTLGHAMAANPEKLEEYVDKYVELAKNLHTTHVPVDSFTRIQEVYHDRVKNLTPW